ncbi:ATP-binding cassette domain-containing protein [Aquincola sp. S2]|uniref:ATP-binding cassette domain-containing protein n=1 Tax=Pseudaquabacterium terrae TaxID=2732868 RepID=A0ABX2ESC9_9BURK|nr:ATP-binding cassette domain-containing protein [Aquabacterium terrae]NRF71566.1 ATP-binding cassette domain-containing protein [Aquabacterium terrae]
MAALRLSGISKHYGRGAQAVAALDTVDLQIDDGELVVFVGPSGSGKSTLLRVLAGLDEPTAGEIHIGERRADTLPPAQRGIAMVFQSYALYPHMNVYDNMAFALRRGGVAKDEVTRRVGRAAEILQLDPLLQRLPRALSGGQRQRVAIGRAIVREPAVFLFDEPLSNLDAALRQAMRVEIARLHQRLGATMVYVTHDQVEAMTLADRIVVFDAGRVQQVGTPAALYETPANLFVAGFLGAPQINRLAGRLLAAGATGAEIEVAGLGRLQLPVDARRAAAGSALTLGLRPEHLQLRPGSGSGQVQLLEYLGDHRLAYVELPGLGEPLCAKVSGHGPSLRTGESVAVDIATGHGLLFDACGDAFPGLK